MRRGFTLIELLVVIAIIGILSSIVFVSLNVARTKGKVGAGKRFEATVNHAAGDSLVGEWKFDECSGTTVYDLSGNNNNGAFSGSPTWVSDDSPYSSGCSLQFTRNTSAAVGYVVVQNSNTLQQTGNNLTVAMWVKPSTVVADGGNTNLIEKALASAQPGWGIFVDTNSILRARLSYAGGFVDTQMTTRWTSIPTNEWSFLVLVVDHSTNRAKWYLNGAAAGTANITSLGSMQNTQVMEIGASTQGLGIDTYGGKMDVVRVYSAAMPTSMIERMYAEEAPRYRLAAE